MLIYVAVYSDMRTNADQNIHSIVTVAPHIAHKVEIPRQTDSYNITLSSLELLLPRILLTKWKFLIGRMCCFILSSLVGSGYKLDKLCVLTANGHLVLKIRVALSLKLDFSGPDTIS